MTIYQVFHELTKDKIDVALAKRGITIPARFHFDRINIVCGPNGSGKTRFLNVVKELYSLKQDTHIMYGYFPALSDRKKHIKALSLPECTLSESLYYDNISFQDFFLEIETQGEDFLTELLQYRSQRQKVRGEKTWSEICADFLNFTGKKLCVSDSSVFVKAENGEEKKLSAVLSELSPGELILFYMTIFLALKNNSKQKCVIILDEPESHLHPKALLSFLKNLQKNDNYDCIWIATHSLFVIPEFKFSNLVYIEKGQVQARHRSIYIDILDSLIGKDNHKMGEFFASVSQWQLSEFIAECFTDPTVVTNVNPEDEQVKLFSEFLKQKDPISVLDFGGGSGRLGLSLRDANNGALNNLTYEICDPKPTCGQSFSVYKDIKDVKRCYDCIVVMNVLHEIPPNEWCRTFFDLHKRLNQDGYILFIEVASLAQGERPNEFGYFLLDQELLMTLFNSKTPFGEIHLKSKQKSICAVVPRDKVCAIKKDTVSSCIMHLERKAYEEIKVIRELADSVGYNARNYAFWLQQYINAKLYNESIDRTQIVLQENGNKNPVQAVAQSSKSNNPKQSMLRRANLNQKQKLCKHLITEAYGMIPLNGAPCNEVIQNMLNQTTSKYVSVELLCGNWKKILEMEKLHYSKKAIARLLKANAIMGHEKSKNRYENQYTRHLDVDIEKLS